MLKQLLHLRTLLIALFVMAGAGNGWGQTTNATINFNSNAGGTKINNTSVTGTDSQGNTWTITTVGTNSFTANSSYYQVGSSSKPATSITFTTTLEDDVNITSFSAKFGGFSGTQGALTLKVNNTTVGTGSLNGTNDVTVSNTSSAIGKVLTVTVTGISKGVKAYNISYTYEPAAADNRTAVNLTGFEAAKTTLTVGETTTTTATNDQSGWTAAYTYSSSNSDVASVDASGVITANATGSATITCSLKVDDNDVSYKVGTTASKTIDITVVNPPYTVTFADGGSVTEASGGAGVKLPSRSDVGAYTFAGWSTDEVVTETTTAPTTIIPAGSYNPTDNVTLYPVYTKGNKTASVSISDYATENNWENGSSSGPQYKSVMLNSDVIATTTGTGNNGKYYSDWRFYQNGNGNVIISTLSDALTLTSVKFTFTVSNTGTLKYSETALTSGTPVDVSGTSAEFTVGNSGSATNGQIRITAIEVNYSASGSTTTYWSYPVAAAMGETTLALSTSSVNSTYGADATVTATVPNGYSGTLEAKSSNESIATASVKGTTITIRPEAVGTTTIIVTAPETSTFSGEAKETINVTVTAPEGKTTAAVNGYGKVTSTSDLKSGEYLIVYEDGNVAFNGGLETLDGVSNTVAVTINNNAIAGSETVDAATFTIDVAARTIKSASGKYIGVLSNSNGLNQSEEASAYTNSFSIDEDGNAVISAAFSGSNMSLRYNNASNQTRFRYYKSGQAPIALYKKTSLTATLNAYGYATYCSEYPLDFSNAKGYSAWQVTGVDGNANAITFVKVTGSVKGGTGLLLMGEHDATVTLTSENSTNELKTNLLKGTLAPTYVESETIYGLSGNTFKKNNDGTFGKNKAYIPASAVDGANNVRTLSLVFVDPTTGIAETKTMTNEDAIYNLAGQRISKTQRGINIVGGKKVLVK